MSSYYGCLISKIEISVPPDKNLALNRAEGSASDKIFNSRKVWNTARKFDERRIV